MARPNVVVALPPDEQAAVVGELEVAGFRTVVVGDAAELRSCLRADRNVGVVILDADGDVGAALEMYGLLHDDGRSIPALMIVSEATLDRLSAGGGSADDEYLTRPYATDSLRWRVEAMCIRSQVARSAGEAGADDILTGGEIDLDWGPKAPVVAVFSPKGGVGKTTVALNLAAAVQVRHHKQVLLVDADTVTGHVITSLALEGVRSVNDAWRDVDEGGVLDSFLEIATNHVSGMKVVPLALSPLHTETLESERITAGLEAARRGVDLVVVDLHPSYHPLNLAVFAASDHVLVPVTPDIPAIRAAVQFTEVAAEIGIRDRLSMVVNRVNSGVSVTEVEQTVNMEALAEIRSGGLLFVRAANTGRTIIDLFPKEKITEDFVTLAGRVLGGPRSWAGPETSRDGGRTATGGIRNALPLISGLFSKREAERPGASPQARPAAPS